MRGLLAAALALVHQTPYRTDIETAQAEREAIEANLAQIDGEPIGDDPREYSTLNDIAEKLISYRMREGCAAEVIVRMALKIGYDSGKDAGQRAGYRAGVDAWMNGEA